MSSSLSGLSSLTSTSSNVAPRLFCSHEHIPFSSRCCLHCSQPTQKSFIVANIVWLSFVQARNDGARVDKVGNEKKILSNMLELMAVAVWPCSRPALISCSLRRSAGSSRTVSNENKYLALDIWLSFMGVQFHHHTADIPKSCLFVMSVCWLLQQNKNDPNSRKRILGGV
jgi:hypothetical protein